MNKDMLLTMLCCIACLTAAGNIKFNKQMMPENHSSFYSFADTLVFPGVVLSGKASPAYLSNDSTEEVVYIITGPCKQFDLFHKTYQIRPVQVQEIVVSDTPAVIRNTAAPRRKFIHGDVAYDYSMHASPDTSFVGNRFTQHHLIANLYATLANRYPVILHFATLQTSIPYVRNYVDASLQFDRKQYNSAMIDRFKGRIRQKLAEAERSDSLMHNEVLKNFNQTQALSGWLNNDRQVQQLLNSKALLDQYRQVNDISSLEGAAGKTASPVHADKDSTIMTALKDLEEIRSLLSAPSLKQALQDKAIAAARDSTSRISGKELGKAMDFVHEYAGNLDALRNAKARQDSLRGLYDSLRNLTGGRKDSLQKMIADGDAAQLLKEYKDSLKGRPLIRFLMGVRELTLGRSYIDYSQLSVRNISLMGFNLEYCDRYYFALAAGKTDFRYLDFLSVSSVPNQYLFLGRAGLGEKEGRHLYLTAYTGRKQASYYVNNKPATNSITGITVETRIPVNKNIYITGEIAKSSYPSFIPPGSTPGKLFSFADRSNEAYSVQLAGCFPKSDTRFSGTYNRLGIYFQSFNILNSNSNSAAWQLQVDQYLMKKKLFLSASARQNDFSTPFTVNNYKSQSLFYSFQASLRLRKWPVLTAAFLPYSQIARIDGQLSISRFYTLMGSASYAYRVRTVYMSSSLVYTRYFNSSNQVGFLLYDAQSWFLNHSVLIKRFTLSGTMTISYSPGYFLFSTGPGLQWRIGNNLELGGGIKYNNLDHRQSTIGYNGNIDFRIGKLGRIGLSFERGYIPGMGNGLFRNDWGKATYSKSF
jgi:hypothetical protein